MAHGRLRSRTEGIPNVIPFLAEDYIWEQRTAGRVIDGRSDFVTYAGDYLGATDPSQPEMLFLSADEYLDQYHWDEPYFADFIDRNTVTREGLASTVIGASVQSGRVRHPELGTFLDAVDELADAYLRLWNAGEAAGVMDLYAPAATIDDTLQSHSISGVDGISSAVGSGAWPDWPPLTIVELDRAESISPPPPPRGRAIYVGPSWVDPTQPHEVRLVLQADDGSGCPGTVAVNLGWDGERVVWERRYHELAAGRRCLMPGTLEEGWWEGLAVPSPVTLRLTSKLAVSPELTVEVYNGDPRLERLLSWGFERFALAGLPPPPVGSVTFLVHETRCRGYGGFAIPGEQGTDILLCYSRDEVCTDQACTTWDLRARGSLLHEYGHAWIAAFVDEATREQYLAEVGGSWADEAADWSERGIEKAADTIKLGLMDYLPSGWLHSQPPCAQLQEHFRLLTGTEPIASCPP